jgi:BTB/POZ domain-containing protein
MDPPSAIPPKETKTAKATQFHVTSIADVCLVFPSGIKIFANVSVLRNASPVFRAMMGPQFQEGQTIINNTASTPEIAFPEDDSEVMLTLARLLHHREIELANKLKAKHIYEVAVLADKYDVCHVVKSALATLPIQRDVQKNACPNMWYLLTAAFIVGHRDVFKKMSTELLWECVDPYITLVRACKTRGEADVWIVGEYSCLKARDRNTER